MPPPAYVILAHGTFEIHGAKTATCLIRYRPGEVVAVIDRTNAGRSVEEVLGYGGSIPVVASFEESLAYRPNRLLIGISPPGGRLPDAWRGLLRQALERGLDLYSGMHTLLEQDPELSQAARRGGSQIVDLRAVPDDLETPTGVRDRLRIPVVLTVGSDCNVGKMTVPWEILERARREGLRYGFVATGQTGVLLAGRGFAVDRAVADFVAGASERLTVEEADGKDLVLVEGQGSLLHPFFSGVTLGLLHGCRPDAMILCHVCGRTELRYCPGLTIPSLARLVEIYEEAASWVKPSRVIGVALATYPWDEATARRGLARAEDETDLPVEDPVRFPTGRLLEACEELREELG